MANRNVNRVKEFVADGVKWKLDVGSSQQKTDVVAAPKPNEVAVEVGVGDSMHKNEVVVAEPKDVHELDPYEVFRDEDDVPYTSSELARRDEIDYNKVGYKGWKDDYLNDEGEYVGLNDEGDEVYYDGLLDTDLNWNRRFDSSSSDDDDSTSTRKFILV